MSCVSVKTHQMNNVHTLHQICWLYIHPFTYPSMHPSIRATTADTVVIDAGKALSTCAATVNFGVGVRFAEVTVIILMRLISMPTLCFEVKDSQKYITFIYNDNNTCILLEFGHWEGRKLKCFIPLTRHIVFLL